MIITCPICRTRFNVDPGQLLPNGRTVKCAKCGHLWTERPPADMPRRVDEPTITVDDLPSTGDDVDDVPDSVERPRRRRAPPQPPAPDDARRTPLGQALGWAILVLVVVGVLGVSVVAREALQAWWPPSQALFELAGLSGKKVGAGLEIRNVAHSQRIEDQKPTLVVAGEIVNRTNEPIDIPKLRGSLHDIREREIYAWFFTAKQNRLAPGEVAPIASSIREPPSDALRVEVRFAE